MRFAVCAFVACFSVGLFGAAPAPEPAAGAVPLTIDWTLTPAQITTTCKAAIERANARITALTRMRSARTFDTVVLPLETILADLNDDTAAQQFLTNVASAKPVRDASQACNTAQSDFYSEVTARPELFAALAAAKASNTAATDAQRKLTDLWLVASTRAGAGLPDAKRAQFVKLNDQLSDIEQKYIANLDNDATAIPVSLAGAAGLPADFVATFTKTATGYLVPVNESTVAPFMQNATDESVRKAFYTAYDQRGGTANVALLESAIAIRAQLAALFGYPNWAAYVLADKMAQTPQRVDAFLAKLDAAILPKAKQERAELAALKGGATFSSWDTLFYRNVLRKQKYRVDAEAIKQYFPVEHTIGGVLAIYAKLLNVTFAPVPGPSYNSEVRGFAVHDGTDGALLGTLALDLYPRPGKYGHFANFPLIPRRVMPDGTVRAPLAIIVGNWSRPAPGRPALLTHAEVETFFHEFGHNMAAMLADSPYETLNAGFRADFIEAPSQMLENWVWDPGILKELSSNVTTGAPLPDALINQMIAARYVDNALQTTQQIAYAAIDMRYHTAGARVDTTAVWNATYASLTPFAAIDGTYPQASFGHLMAGYDAGYYGYLWSKVYAQDMFTAFKSAGLEDPTVGARYRFDILAPARTYEPDAEVAAFLGRPMSPAAFYSELGIAPQTSLRPAH